MKGSTKPDNIPEFPIWLTLKKRALEPGEDEKEEKVNTLKTTTTLSNLLRDRGK